MKICPACNGAGQVIDVVADALTGGAKVTDLPHDAVRPATCSCDGPPHNYDPVRWCPASGPVTNGRHR